MLLITSIVSSSIYIQQYIAVCGYELDHDLTPIPMVPMRLPRMSTPESTGIEESKNSRNNWNFQLMII